MKLIREHYILICAVSLVAIVVFLGLGAFQVADRDEKRVADLHDIQQALNFYFLKYHRYPQQFEDLSSGGIGIQKIPTDPLGHPYSYFLSEDGSSYILLAKLEDGSGMELKSDLDGLINGVNCDDRPEFNYCVSP